MCDKNWAARIKVEKFRSHNQQWLEMVESIGTDSTNHLLTDDDDSLSPFISGDLLKHTILFPSGNIYYFLHKIISLFIAHSYNRLCLHR